ncbi:MAG: hypothetical protein Q4A14_02105, partial [Porphyromonas sp.]|nr:hypothetical protein [Porphyromonas sp.]
MVKKILSTGVFLVLVALLYSCTGIGANVDITVPKGPKGDPGLSAYDVWKENVNNGTIDWPKGEVDINDFFRFLKGKDGKDGKNGVDGKDGKSAYEVWKEFISTGNADDPHNPGKKWNPNRNTEKDFWMFLAGKDGKDGQDGKDGMSAYDLWKKDLADKCGTADQIMNPHNPSQPWPCDKNTMEDFYKYLRGVDGQSAYALWKEKVLDGTIKWPKDQVGETDFFRYLKGKDGKDGKDGVDGLNGLNAYEVWYQYISSGDVEDPHNPGQKWPANKNTMKDFFVYLTGAKGEKGNPGVDGKSAYELWKEELEKRCGTADPMKNPHKPTENWPCDEKGMEDFLRYLRGMDGASAYEIWKKGVLDGSITGWPTNEVSTADFFRYLKGDKGEKGDKGDNGKDGVNGLSAYEIWKKYIEPGNVPNPHNPTEMWNPNENSEQDFWRFLAGKDGKNGLNGVNGKSAYELWKKQVEENCGDPVNQVMNPHDPTKPWICSRVTQNDFWDYLRGPKGSDGKDGKDGEPGQAVEIGRPNVLPVFFNGKLREYVDPTDGSVSFQVFDKDGNKVQDGVKVKGIPGVTDPNHEFVTGPDGKIKVPKDLLPVRFAPGQRAGKALVDLAKNGVFEETAPNILTPNR